VLPERSFWHNPGEMILRDATPAEIDTVLGRTHALWSDGLDPPDYREYIHTLMASDWSRAAPRNYRFLVMVDGPGGTILSAMKLYRFAARAAGRSVTVGGVGAVFTPPEHRRRGHAAAMLGQAHAIMEERGDAASLLYSEIGADYYAGLGYVALPSRPVKLEVPGDGPAAEGTRRMHRSELGTPARLREAIDNDASFALMRDTAYWKHLLARNAYPTLSLGRERWESRLVLWTGEGGAEGYLWSLFGATHEGSAAKLLEHAESRPGAAAGALLDDLFAECRRRGVAVVDAWAVPPGVTGSTVIPVSPHPSLPMLKPLAGDEGAAVLAAASRRPALHLTDLF